MEEKKASFKNLETQTQTQISFDKLKIFIKDGYYNLKG